MSSSTLKSGSSCMEVDSNPVEVKVTQALNPWQVQKEKYFENQLHEIYDPLALFRIKQQQKKEIEVALQKEKLVDEVKPLVKKQAEVEAPQMPAKVQTVVKVTKPSAYEEYESSPLDIPEWPDQHQNLT